MHCSLLHSEQCHWDSHKSHTMMGPALPDWANQSHQRKNLKLKLTISSGGHNGIQLEFFRHSWVQVRWGQTNKHGLIFENKLHSWISAIIQLLLSCCIAMKTHKRLTNCEHNRYKIIMETGRNFPEDMTAKPNALSWMQIEDICLPWNKNILRGLSCNWSAQLMRLLKLKKWQTWNKAKRCEKSLGGRR